jgi:hypothetical protein
LSVRRKKKLTSDTEWHEGAQKNEKNAVGNDGLFTDYRNSVLRNEAVSGNELFGKSKTNNRYG